MDVLTWRTGTVPLTYAVAALAYACAALLGEAAFLGFAGMNALASSIATEAVRNTRPLGLLKAGSLTALSGAALSVVYAGGLASTRTASALVSLAALGLVGIAAVKEFKRRIEAPVAEPLLRERWAEDQDATTVVVLRSVGRRRIAVIRELRMLTGIGLKEAKTLTESTPVAIAPPAPRQEAALAQQRLEAAGADIELAERRLVP